MSINGYKSNPINKRRTDEDMPSEHNENREKYYSEKIKREKLIISGIKFPDDWYCFPEIKDYINIFYDECVLHYIAANKYQMIANAVDTDVMALIRTEYDYTEAINKMANYFGLNPYTTAGNEIINRFKNKIIELLDIVHNVKLIEHNYFINMLENVSKEQKTVLYEDEYLDLIIYVLKTHNLLAPKGNYIEANRKHQDVYNILIANKTIENWFAIYLLGFSTVADQPNRFTYINTNTEDLDAKIDRTKIDKKNIASNYFDIRRNKKTYGLHHVAFPGTYQIDLMFSGTGNNCYLVAIEVNTRYLYITRTNIETTKNNEIKNEKKSTLAVYLAMERLFKQGWNPSVIKSDSEAAFGSDFIKERIYKKRGILYFPVFRITKENGRTAPLHTSLAIVDRVIKTLKTKFKNRGFRHGALPELEVYKFVDHYNNKKHRTLSEIFNRNVTPKEVHDDFNLEAEVIRNRIEENNEIKQESDWKLPENTVVRVYIDKDPFEKRPRVTKLSKYKVLKNINNIYQIESLHDGKKEITSRIKIARD